MRKITPVLCICLVLLAGCTPGETPMPTPTPTPIPTPKPKEIIRNVAYLPDGLSEHTLDLYLPDGKHAPFPTLVMFHGGNGKKEDFSAWGNIFSEKGYAVISINYRQWPDHQYPSNLEDAYCAISWVVKNSDSYQLDPEQIFFLGHSAGGTLAASLGIVNDPTIYSGNCPGPLPDNFQVAGIITFTLIYDYPTAALVSEPLAGYVVDLLGGTMEEIPEIWAQASPANWVDGTEPPFLLIHGEADQSIPPSQSLEFAEIIRAAGGEVELFIVPGGSHMQIKDSTQSMEFVEGFLSRIIAASAQ